MSYSVVGIESSAENIFYTTHCSGTRFACFGGPLTQTVQDADVCIGESSQKNCHLMYTILQCDEWSRDRQLEIKKTEYSWVIKWFRPPPAIGHQFPCLPPLSRPFVSPLTSGGCFMSSRSSGKGFELGTLSSEPLERKIRDWSAQSMSVLFHLGGVHPSCGHG